MSCVSVGNTPSSPNSCRPHDCSPEDLLAVLFQSPVVARWEGSYSPAASDKKHQGRALRGSRRQAAACDAPIHPACRQPQQVGFWPTGLEKTRCVWRAADLRAPLPLATVASTPTTTRGLNSR